MLLMVKNIIQYVDMLSRLIKIIFIQRDHVKTAQSYFQLVGGSASECGKQKNFSFKNKNDIFNNKSL